LTDWLARCRDAVQDVRGVLADLPGRIEREPVVGAGRGGDETTAIDAAAERVVLARFTDVGGLTIVSEEAGQLGDGDTYLVVDPIDGSLNAKRGLPHHALSIAVADGPTMADVAFGYVYDLGPSEEWHAVRGGGAFLDGVALDPSPERRGRGGKLEVVAVESADPRWLAASSEALCGVTGRVRALGTIAVSLCQLAAGRVDGMATLWKCRAVDAAAAQLVVRESGGLVAFTALDDDLAAPLDLEPHSPVVAARTAAALDELRALPAP
jgi:myo-inositol-1(or 4)-monophosphatase